MGIETFKGKQKKQPEKELQVRGLLGAKCVCMCV